MVLAWKWDADCLCVKHLIIPDVCTTLHRLSTMASGEPSDAHVTGTGDGFVPSFPQKAGARACIWHRLMIMIQGFVLIACLQEGLLHVFHSMKNRYQDKPKIETLEHSKSPSLGCGYT